MPSVHMSRDVSTFRAVYLLFAQLCLLFAQLHVLFVQISFFSLMTVLNDLSEKLYLLLEKCIYFVGTALFLYLKYFGSLQFYLIYLCF